MEADFRAACEALWAARPSARPVTVHHPRCEALATGLLRDCTCGGVAFPVECPA